MVHSKKDSLENNDIIDKALRKLAGYDNIDVFSFAGQIAELINDFHSIHDYLGIVFEGAQGTRKTSLAMLILYYLYDDWDVVLNNIYFRIRDFVSDSIDALEKNERRKSRILDDFGFSGGSKWRRSSELVDLLEYLNIVRTVYTSLIFTYVDDSGAKFVRDNAQVKIVLNKIGLTEIEAKVYRRKYTVMGPIWKSVLSFRFDKGVFNTIEGFEEAYQRYWDKRRKYALEKGRKILAGMDQKKLLLLAIAIGYMLKESDVKVREIPNIARRIFNISFDDKVFYGLRRKAKQILIEHNIIEDETQHTAKIPN